MSDDADSPRESLRPIQGADHTLRRRLDLRHELALAALPTLIMLAVLGLLDALSRQRVLFASLSSSAFSIYLVPQHGSNSIRTLTLAQLLATGAGLLGYFLFGHGYTAAGVAMVATITSMVLLDVVHPPAVGTSLTFAFREGEERTIVLFVLALGVLAALVVLERSSLWLLARFRKSAE